MSALQATGGAIVFGVLAAIYIVVAASIGHRDAAMSFALAIAMTALLSAGSALLSGWQP